MMVEQRKVLKVRNSYAVTIPRLWLRVNKVKQGDTIEVKFTKNFLQIKKKRKAGVEPAS